MRGEEIQPQLQITRVLTGSPLQTQEIRPGKKKFGSVWKREGGYRWRFARVLGFKVLRLFLSDVPDIPLWWHRISWRKAFKCYTPLVLLLQEFWSSLFIDQPVPTEAVPHSCMFCQLRATSCRHSQQRQSYTNLGQRMVFCALLFSDYASLNSAYPSPRQRGNKRWRSGEGVQERTGLDSWE